MTAVKTTGYARPHPPGMLRQVVIAALVLGACGEPSPARPRKIYVAAQDAARVDVLDGTTLATIATIDTGARRMPHNVDVTPAGDRVLVTNADLDGLAPDELLLIDPRTDTIVTRVPLDAGAFVAHVIPSPDGKVAFVSGWGSNRIYRVDLTTLTRLPDFQMTGVANPHGMRLSADGALLYTANSAGSVSELDARAGGVLREFPLPGPAVQVAIGSTAVYASVFHPAAVARIDRLSGAVTVFLLPDAHGLAQIALSPDERTVYAAEQGEANVTGNQLYVLDADTGAELARREVGFGAHGVALSPDGKLAFVTCMYEALIAVVDLTSDAPAMVGDTSRGPNGLALWWGSADAP